MAAIADLGLGLAGDVLIVESAYATNAPAAASLDVFRSVAMAGRTLTGVCRTARMIFCAVD